MNCLGNVIIQTYNPDNFSILCSKEQDYERFYNAEINIRKQLKYPPFCDIMMLNVVSIEENEIINAVKFIYNNLINTELSKKALIYKPQPSPLDKIKNKFRWRIIIKCKFDNNIINIINNTLMDFQKNKRKFSNISLIVDVNPNNMS